MAMLIPTPRTFWALPLTTVLLLGCHGGSQAPVASTPAGTSTAITAQNTPVLQYGFFEPASEAEVAAHAIYGNLIVKTRADFDPSCFSALGLQVGGHFTLNGNTYYHLCHEGPVLPALHGLQKTQGILFAHPDLKCSLYGGVTYNHPDPLTLSEQYSAAITHLREAWTTYGFGPYTPYIVDVDTGVNWGHEDFQTASGPAVVHAYSWWDLSTQAFIDGSADSSVTPMDYAGTTTTNTDDDAHGSHTMGILGAQGNNGKGAAGVCWNANLISYKCFNNDPRATNSGSEWSTFGSLAHLIQWKRANHITHTIPVNMSLGSDFGTPFMVDMLEAALENNIVVIAAMGNDGQALSEYPAACSGVIAVGATDGQDHQAPYSTSGLDISVCAPGTTIISTGNTSNSSYFLDTGTSMATPFVTGLVGYMLTFNPDLRPDQIKTYLEANADPLVPGGYDPGTGWGRVNVLKTIGSVIQDLAAQTQPASNYIDADLAVTVMNSLGNPSAPVAGVPLYLYQTDTLGTITNYVSCTLTDGTGLGTFNLLKPGTYRATASVTFASASTPPVVITAGQTSIPPQTLFLPVTYVQVLSDSAALEAPLALVSVMDASSNFLGQTFSSTPMALPLMLTGQVACLLQVTPLRDASSGAISSGGYALYVSSDLYPTTRPAPGTFQHPAVAAGSASQSQASPQPLLLNTLYNGQAPGVADWYAFTLPQ